MDVLECTTAPALDCCTAATAARADTKAPGILQATGAALLALSATCTGCNNQYYDENMATAFINVDHHGAIPYVTDATADIGAVINAIIAELGSEKYGIIYVPGRAYGCSTTIEVPKTCQGFRMIGNGGWYYVNEASGYIGVSSRLLWTGSDGGTIMKSASHGTTIEGIAFVGYAASSGSVHTLANIDNAGIGLQLEYESGIGAGMMNIRNCSFAKCDVGLQFGDADNSNCDQSVVDQPTFYNCTTGIKVNGTQQVGIMVRRPWSMYTGLLDVRGGSLFLDGYDLTSTNLGLINVQTTNTHTYIQLDNVKVDAASGAISLIDCSNNGSTGRGIIVMNNLWHGATAPSSPTIDLKYVMQLYLNNCHQIPEGLIKCTGTTSKRARVFLRDCWCSADPGSNTGMVDAAESTSPWTSTWSGCIDGEGEDYTDGSASGA